MDVISPELTWKWLWKDYKSSFGYVGALTGLWLATGGSHVTGNDVTWSHLTGSDPEVTLFHRKSPGEAVEDLLVKFWVRLSSYRVVTRKRWQSRDLSWR